ncbi:hypothetical protein CQW23_17311 [Capsicum baccatum]|uniref:LysM domain-containing protein n=1 Tax=Capsicum baccatum TaxID=33114 RepID=A0A2G2WDD4_CAPBA|nr:hypothetical protein CQW23_17311 [Capsicum baccatum]
MAKAINNSINCYFNVALVLTFLLTLSPSLGRMLASNSEASQAIPTCTTVYNVDTGDTCNSVIKSFDVNAELFSSLNPNLNCNDLFVGEYLCLNGTLSA